jgi:hypothetical protein
MLLLRHPIRTILLPLTTVLLVVLTTHLQAKHWSENRWAAVIDVEPGVTVCLYKTCPLPEQFAPVNLSPGKRRSMERSELLQFASLNDGDWVTGAVYIEDGARWSVTDKTTIVVGYVDGDDGTVTEVESRHIIFHTTNRAEQSSELHNPDEAPVLITSNTMFDRTSKTDGVIMRVVFPRGSLPKGGEFRWRAPDYAEIRRADDEERFGMLEGRK